MPNKTKSVKKIKKIDRSVELGFMGVVGLAEMIDRICDKLDEIIDKLNE